MAWDIVFPKNNEKEFALVAAQIGYEGLICVYPKGKPQKMPKTKIPLVGCNDIKAGTDKVRGMIEQRRAKVIYNFETLSKKDYMHHRGSGMNQVLAKLLANREMGVGFAFSTLLHARSEWRGRLAGRLLQNIKLCRKYKVPMIVGSFATRPYEVRSFHDLQAYYCSVGMHPKEVTDGNKWLTQARS
ncbi:MAG: RNase P subunit p30 family protein [Candidatus Nanoarchaeia archaeon]